MTLDEILPARPGGQAYRRLKEWFDAKGDDYAASTHRTWRDRLKHFHA